jgi:hypothetical protein
MADTDSKYLPFAAPGHLDPMAVLLALPSLRIFMDQPTLAGVETALALAQRVSPGDRTRFGSHFLVGEEQARVDVYDDGGGESPFLRCRACPEARRDCPHTTAVKLLVDWRSPEARAWLEMPVWRKQLSPLLARPGATQAGAVAPKTVTAPADTGWVRYRLTGPSERLAMYGRRAHEKSDVERVLVREIVKVHKKTGRPTAGARFPATIEDAAARVTVTAADREIDALLEELRVIDTLVRRDHRGGNAKAWRVVEDLTARLFDHLADVGELLCEDEPVRYEREPLRPRMVVRDGLDDTIALSWEPPVRTLWHIGPGLVLLADGVVRPLAADLPRAVLGLLDTDLPTVPAQDAGAFLREVVLRAAVPVDLKAKRLPHLRGTRVEPRPRLRIAGDDGGLRVEAVFVYADADHVREVPPGGDAPWVVLGEVDGTPRLAERDREAEARALATLEELVPAPLPATLTGDAALGLLYELAADDAPLRAQWEVLFDSRLASTRSVGRFSPKISVDSGVDWFDVDVSFSALGKARASLGTLIEAWRAGRRFVRLSGGQIGRIPTDFLARHADALEQLDEIRKASGGKLRAFATPLAAELLGEDGLPPAAKRWRHIAERVRAFDGVPDWPVPPGLTATLRDYQISGFRWLVWLRDLDLGGVLADDMGLGKTLQVLALLLDTHADPTGAPSLVVAPTSVVHNWVSEAARFAPDLRVYLHHGSGRKDALPPAGEVDVVVTSYALLRFDDAIFRTTPFRYVVLDEAQAIKNPTSQIAQACHALQADHRLAVTGTPLENNLVELWSLFQFLMPGFFGGRTAFNTRFTTPVQKHKDEEALVALRGRIRPFVLRRRKDEVARELPPRTEQVLYCELDPTQRRLYESVKDTYRAQVFGAVETLGLERATIQVLEALTRLRQACCDPRLLPFDEARAVATSAKRTLLTDTLDEIIAEGHRTLIFSQWPSLLKLVEEDLKAASVGYLYLDGGTRDRKSLVERWNDPKGPPVFLISLKAGGTGLNLTGADHVIHLDPWWNPAVEAQATDRAHRIGQTRPVMVYKLVARDTVEDKILELQARKKALFDAAVDADRMLVDTLTRADLEAVFAPGR